MDFTKDYYKILGIVPGTQYEQIRSAYRVLAKKYHPDLHPHDTECVECIKEINEAWEVLGNSDNRFIYDTFKKSERKEKQNQHEATDRSRTNQQQRPGQSNQGASRTQPSARQKTYTKKQWVAHEERYYISGELRIKYRGLQDDYLTGDVLKEVVYNLKPTDVQATIRNDDIHRDNMPDTFRVAFAGRKVSIRLKQPVKCTVTSDHQEMHYLLHILDLTIPSVSICDVTKYDGDSFGTLVGIFYGYISITTYTEQETKVTEYYGETGKKEIKTESNNRYERTEFYHANGNTYWSNWTPAGHNGGAPSTRKYQGNKNAANPKGCDGATAGCVPYLLGMVLLILFLPKLIILWPLALFCLLFFLVSKRRWSVIFSVISILFLCFFLFSLLGLFKRHPVKSAEVQDKPAEKQLIKKPLRASRDTLISRYRSWTDYDGKGYEGRYSILQSNLQAASGYKQRVVINGNGEAAYDEMLQKLSSANLKGLNSLYSLLDKIRERDKLNAQKFAEMFVTMIQDIPYAVVLPMACDSTLYHDRFVSSYLSEADARCDANQRFGINAPIEFLAGLNGDCDTRTLLIYAVLRHYGYHVALLSSNQYSHSLIGIDLPYEGAAFESAAGRFILWETTSKLPPGLLPNEINNLNYWRISLISKL
jgi:hypothetical protein